MVFHLWTYITDVDECELDVNGTLCPETSKCVNLDPEVDPKGFRCECPNGKPPVNKECDGMPLHLEQIIPGSFSVSIKIDVCTYTYSENTFQVYQILLMIQNVNRTETMLYPMETEHVSNWFKIRRKLRIMLRCMIYVLFVLLDRKKTRTFRF